jgi:hypothetical protein
VVLILPWDLAYGIELTSILNEAQIEKQAYLTHEQLQEHRVVTHCEVLSLPPPSQIISGKTYYYVVDAEENLLIADPERVSHHSYLSQGKPVVSAGEIQFQNGKVVYIDNKSMITNQVKSNFAKPFSSSSLEDSRPVLSR